MPEPGALTGRAAGNVLTARACMTWWFTNKPNLSIEAFDDTSQSLALSSAASFKRFELRLPALTPVAAGSALMQPSLSEGAQIRLPASSLTWYGAYSPRGQSSSRGSNVL